MQTDHWIPILHAYLILKAPKMLKVIKAIEGWEKSGFITFNIFKWFSNIPQVQALKTHLPSVRVVPLGRVSWFLWQQSRLAAGRHFCPEYIQPPLTEADIKVKRWHVCGVYKNKSPETRKDPSDSSTSLAARSCCTIAELTVVGMVWILSRTAFSRSRTPWKKKSTYSP